jgi:hypothetical protein
MFTPMDGIIFQWRSCELEVNVGGSLISCVATKIQDGNISLIGTNSSFGLMNTNNLSLEILRLVKI